MIEDPKADGVQQSGQQSPGNVAPPVEQDDADEQSRPNARDTGREPTERSRKPLLVQLTNHGELTPYERGSLDLSRRTYWIALVGSLAAIGAAIFVASQVVIMTRQTQIMASQTESAAAAGAMNEYITRKQLETSRQQLEGMMAAVVTLAESNNFKDVDIDLINVGHVTARDVRVALEITKRQLPSEKVIGQPAQMDYTITEMPADPGRPVQRQHAFPLSSSEQELLSNTKLTVRVEGTFQYFNGFETVRQDVCYSYVAKRMPNNQSWNDSALPCSQIESQLRQMPGTQEDK